MFLTQIVKGEMQKVNLCEACSKEKGVTDPTGFALAETPLGFGHGEKIETQPQEKTCPACGMPQSTFRKPADLGPRQMLRCLRGGTRKSSQGHAQGHPAHREVPERAAAQAAPAARLAELRTALDEAVAAEKFEEAARLRDEILRFRETSNFLLP